MSKRTLGIPPIFLFVGMTLLLVILGSLFIFDASGVESFNTFGSQYHFFQQHMIGVIVGLILMTITSYISLPWLLKMSPFVFAACVFLCLLVFVPGIGLQLNGARSWLSLGPIVFQPVEAMKLGVIVYFSYLLSFPNKFKQFAIMSGLVAVLIMLQPDLGSLSIVAAIILCVYFLSGGEIKKMLMAGAIITPLVLIAIFMSPYRLERVKTFMNPESDPLGSSFHYRQLILALGRGGIMGQGLGKSNQKYSYVPEASTDSIFAIIAEEIGFVGSLCILLLFAYFFYLATIVVLNANVTQLEKVVGMSIISWIGIQTMLNLGAVVGLIPLTGTPLPFFSYGRSSLVMLLCATGLIINIGRRT